jgi:hypothetical protein
MIEFSDEQIAATIKCQACCLGVDVGESRLIPVGRNFVDMTRIRVGYEQVVCHSKIVRQTDADSEQD